MKLMTWLSIATSAPEKSTMSNLVPEVTMVSALACMRNFDTVSHMNQFAGSESDGSSGSGDSNSSGADDQPADGADAGAGADQNDDDGFVRRKRVGKKPRRQRPAKPKSAAAAKKKRTKDYIERDAEVAGEDEDEDEEEYAALRKQGYTKQEYQKKVDERLRAESDAVRAKRAGELSTEEIVANLHARYKPGEYAEEVDTGDLDVDQANLPDMRDPKLWMMRCKEGSEVMILIALLNKYVAKAEAGEQLGIMSAVNTSKGVIFVESYREAQVRQAVAGITDLYGWKPDAIKLVPVNQMTAAVYVSASRDIYKRGMFVRFNRGVYKGDLAQVVQVIEGGSKVLVKTVPRIDYKAMAAAKDKRRSAGRKAGPRPAQRLYDRGEFVAQTGGDGDVTNVLKWGMRMDKIGSSYYSYDSKNKEGLLYKEVSVEHVTPHGPAPSLEEIAHFKSKKATDDKNDAAEQAENAEEQLLDTLKSAKSTVMSEAVFEAGDSVVVVKGDLAGLTGHVVVINAGGTFTLQPSAESSELLGINEKLEIASDEAVKTFDVGDHVKVLAGMFKGETGTVLATRSASSENPESFVFVATLLLDSGQKTVEVFVRDLTKTTEVVTSVTSVDGYELHDLVEVPGGTAAKPDAGCVVQLGQRELTVLLPTNEVMRFPVQEIRGKINYKGATGVAMSQGMALAVGDVVRVVQGPPGTSNFTGVIKHIYGMRLFLHSYAYPGNSGILSVRPQQVILASRKNAGADQKTAVMTTVGRPMARRGMQSDLGKSVIITRGRWKGRLGMIRNETDTHYSVELHQAQQKHVTILKAECSLVGDAKGSYNLPGSAGSFIGGQTPHVGGATPFAGAHTPAFGGQTPMFGGGMTPGMGGRTPAYGGQGGTVSYNETCDTTPHFDDLHNILSDPFADTGVRRRQCHAHVWRSGWHHAFLRWAGRHNAVLRWAGWNDSVPWTRGRRAHPWQRNSWHGR